jgi:cyclopropane-fatty-acyl-phospholipid synthase
MAVDQLPQADPAVGTARALFATLLGGEPADFAVRFWDGSVWPGRGEPRCTLVLNHPGAARRMFWPPGPLAVCEAYMFGDYDVEGDFEAFINVLDGLPARRRGLLTKLRLLRLIRRLPATGPARPAAAAPRLAGRRHSVERDRQAVSYHYDLSNDFYALWLDRAMVYSCGYFRRPDDDLDTAQANKLEHICRKLRLKPGQRLLDIGCGWGGLILHAARHHGVEATGITLSARQAEWIGRRVAELGLAGRCRVELRDYREAGGAEPFDALASVGMAEHVGAALLPTYFRHAWRLLRPGGVMLNHAIGINPGYTPPRGPTIAKRYVFPDGELEHLNETLRAAERVGFEVRDVESLREHYALTLRHWARRLERNADAARKLTGEVTYRTWRMYMTGAAVRFHNAQLTIHQTLLLKPTGTPSGLPLTRADWYAPDPPPGDPAP